MNNPLQKPIWDRQENEPSLWYGRFRIFLELGPSRSVNAVFAIESKQKQGNPSTNVCRGWYHTAREWEWEQRASAYDAHWIKEQDKLIAQEREKIVRSGFALQHKRIQVLDRLANKLLEMVEDADKVWVPGTKVIWNGKTPERVDYVDFNAQLFSLIEKYLASIAAEMGERVKKQHIEVDESGSVEKEMLGIHKAIEKALKDYPQAAYALAQVLAELQK